MRNGEVTKFVLAGRVITSLEPHCDESGTNVDIGIVQGV